MFWLQTVILTLALALILVGIWHEEKLIAFENRVADYISDRIGYHIAQIIIRNRKRKAAKLQAQRNARANEIAQARRSRIHVVATQNQGNTNTTKKYIA
ncbi:MAG: hypothetical protein IJ261_00475 [Clostridia bacterium]|nr:hypothetical protein [Clostridia bacterium]